MTATLCASDNWVFYVTKVLKTLGDRFLEVTYPHLKQKKGFRTQDQNFKISVPSKLSFSLTSEIYFRHSDSVNYDNLNYTNEHWGKNLHLLPRLRTDDRE